jgi:hypothetical protein
MRAVSYRGLPTYFILIQRVSLALVFHTRPSGMWTSFSGRWSTPTTCALFRFVLQLRYLIAPRRGREWQRVFNEKLKLRSFERPNGGFVSPSKALEHILGGSPTVSAHRMRLQAATVSSGGSNDLRVALVRNFSDNTDAVEAMLRAQAQPESDGVPQPVSSPW